MSITPLQRGFFLKAALSIVFVVMLSAWTPHARAFDRSPLDQSEADSYLPLRLQDSCNDAQEDWTRFLSRAEDRGIRFELNYKGEVFHAFRVEPSGKTLYRGLLDIYFGLDTEKASLWPGGRLFIKLQEGHGRGFSVNPSGVAMPISNIEAQNFTQISEFGLKQTFLDGRLRLRLSKQDVNSVFCVNESGGNFIFPSFTLIPTVPMPTFPAPALGVTFFADPAKEISAGAGLETCFRHRRTASG